LSDVNRLSEKKDLNLVTGFRKCIAVKERECCLGWVIRTPSTFHEDFEFRWVCGGRDGGPPLRKTGRLQAFLGMIVVS